METVEVECGDRCNSATESQTRLLQEDALERLMASTPLGDTYTDKGMVSMPAAQGDVKMKAQLPDSGLWKGECHRIVFSFADAKSGAPLTDMQPFLGAAMHALVVAERSSDQGITEEDMMHTHGYPSQLEHTVASWNENEHADICSMQIHTMMESMSEIGPEVVMYARFPHAGKHHVFVQVRAFLPISWVQPVMLHCLCQVPASAA